jgi:hypothetical protein
MGRRAPARNPGKSRVSDGEGAIITCIYPTDKGVDTRDAGLGGQHAHRIGGVRARTRPVRIENCLYVRRCGIGRSPGAGHLRQPGDRVHDRQDRARAGFWGRRGGHGSIVGGLSRRSVTGLVALFPCGDRTCSANVFCCAIGAGQTPSLPPAISLDLAAAGHVALASSEPGGELGEAGGEAR